MPIDVVDKRRRGFFIVDDEVIDAVPASIFTKMTYIILVRHADKDRVCYPSMERISKEAGMSVAQARRAIKELEQMNMLEVQRRNGSHNCYLLLDKSVWQTPLSQSGVKDTNPALVERGQKKTPLSQSAGPRSTRAQNYTQGTKHTHTNAACECFLDKYPSKKRQDKARGEWAALKPDEPLVTEIMAGLDQDLQSDMWTRGVGIPYPDRYLKERLWQDAAKASPPPGDVKGEARPGKLIFIPRKDGTWSRWEGNVETVVGEADVPIKIINQHKRQDTLERGSSELRDLLSGIGRPIPGVQEYQRAGEYV